MWHSYRKTFIAIQMVIWVLTVGVYFLSNRALAQTAACLVVMQLSAMGSARWATRMGRMSERKRYALPLEPRI